MDYGLDPIIDSLIESIQLSLEHFGNTDESTAVQRLFHLHNVNYIRLHVVSRVSPITQCEAG